MNRFIWRVSWLCLGLLLGQTSLASARPSPELQETLKETAQELVAAKQANPAPLCLAQLPAAIDRVVNQGAVGRSQWSILVQTLNSGQTLYNLNEQQLLVPASNIKLLTSAAAIAELGSQFRIRTSIYDVGNNSLLVIGRGDPSLSNTHTQLLSQQLRSQGRSNINTLIADDSYFQGQLYNPNWALADIINGNAPPVNSLIVNQSYVELSLVPQQPGQPLQLVWSDEVAAAQWRIENHSRAVRGNGSSVDVDFHPNSQVMRISGNLGTASRPEEFGISVRDPALYFLQRLQTDLTSFNISVGQAQVQRLNTPVRISPQWREVAFVESAPLGNLLFEVNGNSNNFYAEMLTRAFAAQLAGTDADWPAVVQASLGKLGIDPTSYQLVDGSGLARNNRASSLALVQTLQSMARSRDFLAFRDSLSVAGVSGTLRNRLRNTQAQGNLWGKTGTLRGVASLSGYFYSPSYDPLVFSVIVNNSQLDSASLRQAIDQVVIQLGRLQRC